jgi:hypothetical protein
MTVRKKILGRLLDVPSQQTPATLPMFAVA